MTREVGNPSPVDSSKDKEKELRRVYRKLKGVRSELSVKIRELKKEVRQVDHGADEGGEFNSDGNLETTSENDDLDEKPVEPREKNRQSGAPFSTQYEVKSLIDHKKRLRKRFWKLQEEVRRHK
ncbi:MAG: hypothetical protein WED04_08895 [Promethearchaeati archaeon SRVP18_Atabeyarchaeia-1]